MTKAAFRAGAPVTPLRPGSIKGLEKSDRFRLANHISDNIISETVLEDVVEFQDNVLVFTLEIEILKIKIKIRIYFCFTLS